MLWATVPGGLELREAEGGETRLLGSFPYGQETVLREARPGSPELREVFAPRAFADAPQTRNIHLLANHDFAKPMASTGAATLILTDTAEALLIEARLKAPFTSWTHDAVTALRAGLMTGLSPGFQVAHGRGAEKIEERGNVILRTVSRAVLQEISLVTRPAYPQAQVEARSWTPGAEGRGAIHGPHVLTRHVDARYRRI